jgi:hypothetical protein
MVNSITKGPPIDQHELDRLRAHLEAARSIADNAEFFLVAARIDHALASIELEFDPSKDS